MCSVYERGTAADPYKICGQAGSDALAIQWTIDVGLCGAASGGSGTRKAFGRTYYESCRWLQTLVGQSALTVDYRYYFRAWMSNILRSHFLVKRNAPNFIDFYAATVSRLGGAGIAFNLHNRLTAVLEALRLASGGALCFK